jgi:hypothetical protein
MRTTTVLGASSSRWSASRVAFRAEKAPRPTACGLPRSRQSHRALGPPSAEHPIHGQEVDDVGPSLPALVSVAHQLHGDRVAVGVVADSGRGGGRRGAFGVSVASKARRSSTCIGLSSSSPRTARPWPTGFAQPRGPDSPLGRLASHAPNLAGPDGAEWRIA